MYGQFPAKIYGVCTTFIMQIYEKYIKFSTLLSVPNTRAAWLQ